MSKMIGEFFEQDLSQLEIKRLIQRIIRYKPNWIYSICKDPRRVEREKGFINVFKKEY